MRTANEQSVSCKLFWPAEITFLAFHWLMTLHHEVSFISGQVTAGAAGSADDTEKGNDDVAMTILCPMCRKNSSSSTDCERGLQVSKSPDINFVRVSFSLKCKTYIFIKYSCIIM